MKGLIQKIFQYCVTLRKGSHKFWMILCFSNANSFKSHFFIFFPSLRILGHTSLHPPLDHKYIYFEKHVLDEERPLVWVWVRIRFMFRAKCSNVRNNFSCFCDCVCEQFWNHWTSTVESKVLQRCCLQCPSQGLVHLDNWNWKGMRIKFKILKAVCSTR